MPKGAPFPQSNVLTSAVISLDLNWGSGYHSLPCFIRRPPMLDHIGLRTNRFNAMFAFYKAALAPSATR